MIYQVGQVFVWPGGELHIQGVKSDGTMACCTRVVPSSTSHEHLVLPLELPDGAELLDLGDCQ